ncbi:hypothetical protein CALVIDRAFT_217325 [Calocera viscosa TUFC12733]|uniref:F-box domain-containing protein n=1 Tax=Calocera viscosa (strain TUFC12733) TaxID=1330018 RepID=A0A167RHJ2_CALVF|nr:hypothetical protein CALVIDRAFT_217325 [Calocera viscosa TUFC12733]
MEHTMLTTTLTPYGLSKRETTSLPHLLSDVAALNLHHVLIIDLKCREDQQSHAHAGRRLDPADLRRQESDRYATFLHRIREVVRLDVRGIDDDVPPVDALCFLYLSDNDPPRRELCQALDGLRPRVLMLECGWDEVCDVDIFDMLRTPFPLESLVVAGACAMYVDLEREYLRTMRTLVLNCCCSLDFPAIPRPVALSELVIKENDAMDTICRLRERTRMLDGLESLKLTSNTLIPDLTSSEFSEFLEALKAIVSLRTLELVLGYDEDDVSLDDLPQCLPHNLERFTFRSRATHAEPWIRSIQDHEWLPRLREFGFLVPRQKLVNMVREAMAGCRPEVTMEP